MSAARSRSLASYGLLSLPILIWCLVVLPNHIGDWADVSINIVYGTVSVFQLVAGDISIFGEITPFFLATAIIALIPPSKNQVNIPAVLLASAGYVSFLHLNFYFTSGEGVGLLNAIDWPNHNITEPQKV